MKSFLLDVSRHEPTPPTTLRECMSVEGRKLGPADLRCLDAGLSIAASLSFFCPALANNTDEKWKVAFRQVVEATPILQTKIVGEPPNAVFTKLEKELWPSIRIHRVESDDDDKHGVTATTREVTEPELKSIREDGPEAVRSVAVRMHVIVGPSRVALAVAGPHCFVDGNGLATILLKTIAYAYVPKFLWFVLNHFSTKEVPSYYEMLLKEDIGIIDKLDDVYAFNKSKSRPGLDPNNFRFKDFNVMDPGAKTLLNGFIGDLSAVPSSRIEECRAELRNASTTITPAFSALAIKTLAIILDERNLNPEGKPLISFTGCDGRWYGQWGDRRRNKKIRFPVVANYPFACEKQIPMKDALDDGIPDLAKRIKDEMNTLDTDLKARVLNIAKATPNSSGILVGVSSIVVPSQGEILGFRDFKLDAGVNFGPWPHVWFYIVTMNKLTTMVAADIMLPIELDEEEVKLAIKEAAAGSPLEMFFEGVE